MHFAVDPRNSANQIITDIDKAPKNAAGKVEFSSDFYLIKPKNLERGNGTLLYEVSNRGGKGMVGFFNFASGSLDPQTADQFGDAFLLEQGFTLLWLGWQFDPPQREELMRVYAPVARAADGSPIQGLVRSNFVPTQKVQEASLADRNHMAYPVADPKDSASVLTVRDSAEGASRTIPRDQWDFTPDRTRVRMATGFEPHKIYEVVYKSQDPPVVGVGPAAVRDMVSMLKYGSSAELSVAPRRDQTRDCVRYLPERALPPHLSLLRLQRGRSAPEGVRRDHGSRGRQRPRQLQSSVRPAVARRASALEFFISDGHFPVYRRAADRS